MKFTRTPLWSIATVNDEVLSDDTDADFEFTYVDIASISDNRISDSTYQVSFREAPSRARRVVQLGDIALSTVRTYLRAIAPVTEDYVNAVFSTGFAIIRTDQTICNPSFLRYALLSDEFIDEVVSHSNGVSYPSITAGEVMRICIDFPILEAQQRIADYLDRETAEIDAAVADLDRYVELLEKRKRATGLAILEQARHEPTTLMVHLGSLGLFVSGSGFPHRYQGVEGEEFPFYKVGSLSTADEDGIIQDSRHSVSREVAEELGAKIIPTGSVLMAKIGEAMRLCRFVVTATDCCIDNNMMAIIPRQDSITSDYLRLALELVTVDVLVNPGPVPSLNVQGLRMFSIPLPSVGVQKRMTTEWNKETDRLDSLIAESTRLRDLLIKRRSVLITEVVTGRKQV